MERIQPIKLSQQLVTLADQIRVKHEGAIAAARKTVLEMIECGKLLIAAHKRCAHGEWLPFLAQCRVNEKTYRRYRDLYIQFEEFKKSGRGRALLANGATVAELLRSFEVVMEHQVGPYKTDDYQKRRAKEETDQLLLPLHYESVVVPALHALTRSPELETLKPATLSVIKRDLLKSLERVEAVLAKAQEIEISPDHQP